MPSVAQTEIDRTLPEFVAAMNVAIATCREMASSLCGDDSPDDVWLLLNYAKSLDRTRTRILRHMKRVIEI